jgi:hypothetical protein
MSKGRPFSGGSLRACIGALVLASAAATGVTQAPPTPLPSDDIVVTGSRVTARAIERAARAVTSAGDLYREPLAQFQAPVCPGVIGMPADYAASMVARIRAIAEHVRIRLARPDRCKANLLVIFVPNGQAALQNMRGRGPWLFGAISPADLKDLAADPILKDLAADPGPIHVWVSTEARGRYGEALTGRGDPGEPATLTTPNAHSHIFMASRQDIVASVIVIDLAAVHGMPALQVADYAAMRGLARTRPPSQPNMVGTILNLFDKDAVPPLGMTRFDLAYLRAIYSSIPNIAGISKVGRVAYEVKKAANKE